MASTTAWIVSDGGVIVDASEDDADEGADDAEFEDEDAAEDDPKCL